MIYSATAWAALPQDVVTGICTFLDDDGIMSMRCTCKAWAAAPILVTCSSRLTVGLLRAKGLQHLMATQHVPRLCLHQPDPPTSGTIEFRLPPQTSREDLYSPFWQLLAASTHLTSLCLLGSFALLLPPPFPDNANDSLAAARPQRHVQQPTNAADLDLDFFFGDTPSPADMVAATNLPPETSQLALSRTSRKFVRPQQADPQLKPQSASGAYPSPQEFASALVHLTPSLQSLTLQNAPLTPHLCDTIEQLAQLTHLDLSTSEKVYAGAGDAVGGVQRPDGEAWAKWRHQGSTHEAKHVALPDALLHCTRLAISKLQGLQRLSVRGQQGLPWAAIESMTQLRGLSALDIARCIDMPNTALYQIFAGLPGLRHLDASFGNAHMWASIALPPSHLHLSRGAVAGEAWPPAAAAHTAALTFLSLAGRVVTPPLVALVATMAALRFLDVSSCQLEQEHAPLLAPLSALRALRGIRMRHMLGRFNYQATGLDVALGSLPHLEEIDMTHAESFHLFALNGTAPQPPVAPAAADSADSILDLSRRQIADLLDACGTGGSRGSGDAAAATPDARRTDDTISDDLMLDATGAAAAADQPPAADSGAAANAPHAFPALQTLVLADTSLLQRSDFAVQPLLTQLTYLDLSDSGQPDTFFMQVLTRTPQLRHLDLSTSAFAMPTLWKVLNAFFLPHLQSLSLKLCRLVFEDDRPGCRDAHHPLPTPASARDNATGSGLNGDADDEMGSLEARRRLRATDAEARLLGSLTGLQCLELAGTRVTDAAMPHIAGLTALTRLDLRDCLSLTAAGVTHVSTLTSLRHFSLSFVKMHGDCAVLAPLQALTFLLLVSCGLRDKDVADALREGTRLRVLRLDNSDLAFTAGPAVKSYDNSFSASIWGPIRQQCGALRVLGVVLEEGEEGSEVAPHVDGLMRCSSIREVTIRFLARQEPEAGSSAKARNEHLCQLLLIQYGQAFQASNCTFAPVSFWFPASR
eukprot:jgi/Ulvmu1/9590/UM054_0020.1